MIKKCPSCKKKKEMRSNQKYCSAKCKKTFENSLRSAPRDKTAKMGKTPPKPPHNPPPKSPSPCKIARPQYLNAIAGAYWDRIAPTVEERGHLNVLSEDTFAELCDLHSRLMDINMMINNGTVQKCGECGFEMAIPSNRSLLQIDDKWSIKDGVETACFKESALSDLKRKYSKQFLDYCKAFYLTPLSNRGNFGLDNEEEKDPEEEFLSMVDK